MWRDPRPETSASCVSSWDEIGASSALPRQRTSVRRKRPGALWAAAYCENAAQSYPTHSDADSYRYVKSTDSQL